MVGRPLCPSRRGLHAGVLSLVGTGLPARGPDPHPQEGFKRAGGTSSIPRPSPFGLLAGAGLVFVRHLWFSRTPQKWKPAVPSHGLCQHKVLASRACRWARQALHVPAEQGSGSR